MTSTSLSYKVLHGSSIDLLKTFPEKSINAIITDPPYNISKNNNFTTMGRAGIDFGEWDKGFDLTSWIEDASRIIVPGGAIVIFNAWRNLGTISDSLEKHGFDIKDVIRWVKNNPMPRNIDRRFVVDYEYAIWAVKKGASWTFNNLSDTYERPEIKCGLTPKNEKSLGVHPTQKPVEVMKWLVERLTNKGDIVLDPFTGSGSTGVACKESERSFIGIELDPEYHSLAESRLGIRDHNSSDIQS